MADTHDRLPFELLQESSRASVLASVLHTASSVLWSHLLERRRERRSYRLETVLVLGINASATVDAEVL